MSELRTPEYTGIAAEYQIEYIIEKSRFIATAAPCHTEAEAAAFIQRISKNYWDASHNCTAYCLGPRQEQQRSSDNGEPSGTAGKPMLEVLKKTGITDTVIVVTRYFGGIKLGAGGLIRAYAHSAALVVQEAPKLLYTTRKIITITVEYALFGAVERFLKENNYTFSSEFGADVDLEILVPPNNITTLQTSLTNITDGSLLWAEGELRQVQLPL